MDMSDRLGQSRACWASVLTLAILGACGPTNLADESPRGMPVVPLAVVESEGGDRAAAEGTVRFGECVLLDEPGAGLPLLLVWPARRTVWNPDAGFITFTNPDATQVRVRAGQAIRVGGGGESVAEGADRGDVWRDKTQWVVPPSPSCPMDARWFVWSVELL